MDYVRLGRSGLEVSRVCVGGMSFGAPSAAGHRWTIGPEETEAVIRRAFDRGVNYLDTANCYAGGTSEDEVVRLEEPYVAHDLAGVMARPGERPVPGAGKRVGAGRREERDHG